jgi:18S rRNA (guanine1575-N7)-methyltransferase
MRLSQPTCSPSPSLNPSPPKKKQFAALLTDTSISVLQWLLNAETSHPTSSPPHRLTRFFTTLHSALRNPSRAVLQFYPTSDDQVQLITSIAQRAGFGGGIVVDYPNSKKARKVFLCLFVGDGGGGAQMPRGCRAMRAPRRVRTQRRRLRGGDSASRGEKGMGSRRWSRADETGSCGRKT